MGLSRYGIARRAVKDAMMGRKSLYRLYRAIVEVYYPELLNACRERRCPFCNRKFKNSTCLQSHLTHGTCAQMLSRVIENVADLYFKLSRHIKKTSVLCIHVDNGINVCTDSHKDLVHSAVKHGILPKPKSLKPIARASAPNKNFF